MTGETRSIEVPLVDMRHRVARTPPPPTPEDQARADLYALVARLLLAPPEAELLAGLASAGAWGGAQADHPLERAWQALVAAAASTRVEAVRDEFDRLFVSVGTPLINPYASLYLSGFLMEKPLAALRDDLAALGLVRRPGRGELEDHLGALCETMRLLIVGAPQLPRRSLELQRQFFDKHIAPWYEHCLEDIRRAEGSDFYRHVADFTQTFFEVETEAFEMNEDDDAGAAEACVEQ